MIGVDVKSDGIADALSLANHDAPASDITNTQYQSALADSILDAPIVGNHSDPNWAIDSASDERHQEELYDSEVEAQAAEADAEVAHGPEAPQFDEEENELLDMAEASQREPQAEQLQPFQVTHQDIDASIRNTDAFVAEHQLVDSVECDLLRVNLSSLGISPVSSEVIQSSIGRLGVSALQSMEQAGWNLENVRPLHPLQSRAIHDEFCRLRGEDPQLSPVANREAFGADVMFFVANFMRTVNERGLGATIEQLNDPILAEAAVNRLNSHYGDTTPVNRATAVQVVNMLTRPLLSFARRYANHAQAQQPTQSRSSGRQRKSSARVSRSQFQTNRDIFDDETLEVYRQNHGRL